QAGLTFAGAKWALTTFHASNWHPLTWFSHMLDCQCLGLDPGAHHLVSVFLHATNAGLLLMVLFRLTGALWPSAFVAAIFAWHPIRVESVAWVAERKDVLSTFFWISSIWAYRRYVDREPASTSVSPANRAGWKTALATRQRSQGWLVGSLTPLF